MKSVIKVMTIVSFVDLPLSSIEHISDEANIRSEFSRRSCAWIRSINKARNCHLYTLSNIIEHYFFHLSPVNKQ